MVQRLQTALPNLKRTALALALALPLTVGAAMAEPANTINVLNTDQEFVPQALHDGRMEARDAQFAQRHAASAAVRDYAAMLLKDYTDANAGLSNLGQQKNIALDVVAPDSVPADTSSVVTRDTKIADMVVRTPAGYGVGGRMPPDRGWEQQNGPAFDRSFMRYEIQQHLIDIALYKDEIATGRDPDLVAHATAMLPRLYAQLNAAQRFMGTDETPMTAT